MKLYILAFKHYADFSGRGCRREVIWFAVFNILFAAAAAGLDIACGLTTRAGIPCGIYPLYVLSALCPGLALMARRLHDTDKSAWMLLILLIPIIGPIWLLVLLFFIRGDSQENQYGPPPTVTGLPLRIMFYYTCVVLSVLQFAFMIFGSLAETFNGRIQFVLVILTALPGLLGGWLLLRRIKKGFSVSIAGLVLAALALWFSEQKSGGTAALIIPLFLALPLLFAWLSFPRTEQYGPLPSLVPARWVAIPLRTRFYYISTILLGLLFAFMMTVFVVNILDGDRKSNLYAISMISAVVGAVGCYFLLKRKRAGIFCACAGAVIMVVVFLIGGEFVRVGYQGQRYIETELIVIMALMIFLALCASLLFPRPKTDK